MSCCGGGRPQKVRQQVVESVPAPMTVVQRRVSKQSAQPISIQRQYVLPRQSCVKCGYPTLTVNISGRERQQCSNANCRTVVQ